MTDKTQLLAIAGKYLQGTASEEEIRLLHEWYDSAAEEEIEMVFTTRRETEQELGSRVFAGLQEKMKGRRRRIPLFKWAAAAAVIGILMVMGGFWLSRRTPHEQVTVKTTPALPKIKDLPPGGDKAKLVLADGTVIILEDVKDGAIKNGSGIAIRKKNGLVVFDISNSSPARQVTNNLITTPRGGQYQVILPDGTKVWLNASSSLQFPTAFSDTGRKVTLTGEAYFEVAAKKIPFRVAASGAEVEVLGTHFNINAYGDEPDITTTLLEGKVKVLGKRSVILKPGEQAAISNASQQIAVETADLDQAIAWKNGLFLFNGTELRAIMRQIARWYNIDVRYEGNFPVRTFTGEIPRNINVSGVLRLLETGGVHFRLESPLQEGQIPKIVVLP